MDFLALIGLLLIPLVVFVFIMISVFYAMGEWHNNRNMCKNLNSQQ